MPLRATLKETQVLCYFPTNHPTNCLCASNNPNPGCFKKGHIPKVTGRFLRPYEGLYNHFLRETSANRLRKGHKPIANEISYEDFLGFVKIKACHYCLAPIVWLKHASSLARRRIQASAYNLDRKDDGLGYIKGNVVVCCKRCNWGKGQGFTYDEWWMMTACFRGGEGWG